MQGNVTALRLLPGGRRVRVFLDGVSAFSLIKILAAGLQTGQWLDEDDVARLERENAVEEAFQRCLGLLARRPRSTTEIRRALQLRKVGAAEADAVMRRLVERGLLHDGEFARAWVDNRQDLRPRSKRALQAELRLKGVGRSEIDSALSGVNEAAAARKAARNRVHRLEGLPWPEFYKKMMAFLAGRGFNFELSRDTARRVWQETGAVESHGTDSEEDC